MPPLRSSFTAAAGLPANRLPIGTPKLLQLQSPPSFAEVSNRAKSIKPRNRLGGPIIDTPLVMSSPPIAAPILSHTTARHSAFMQTSLNEEERASLALNKLERQNRRIEELNASLSSHIQHGKPRKEARPKGKTWKPLDLSSGMQEFDEGFDDTTSESSHFPAPSSVMARQTSGDPTLAPTLARRGMSRTDSYMTSDEFKVFTSRRNKKAAVAVATHENKPTTLLPSAELNPSKREICDVFGNELPGPSFIDANPGSRDGLVQFVQHPNGDISARQWSEARFEWENIGQFSNVRKKVEGQLASDRLKGETGWQALQQNSLVYFRLVAKQREAAVMQLPFGPEEVNAALPDVRPPSSLPAIPTGPRQARGGAPTSFKAQGVQSEPHQVSHAYSAPGAHNTLTGHGIVPSDPTYGYGIGTRSDSVFRQSTNGERRSDPFSSQLSHQRWYGGAHATGCGANQFTHPNYNGFWPSSYSHNWSYTSPDPASAGYYQSQPSFYGDPRNAYQSVDYGQAWAPTHTAGDQASHVDAYHNHRDPTLGETEPSFGAYADQNECAESATPYEARSIMRDTVMKMPEQAKERNKSQSNIRTVLHDPYSNRPSLPEQGERASDTSPPEATQASLEPSLTEHIEQSPSAGYQISGVPVRLVKNSSSLSESSLRDSSPDRDWQRKPAEKYAVGSTSLSGQPTPQTFKGPFFLDDLQYQRHAPKTKKWTKESHDEALNDWWWSGNKFARQEEFYESIRMAKKQLPSEASATVGLPALEDGLTRMLIPVLENLSAYVQGPQDKRRDYFCRWAKASEWCIDHSPEGNNSFFDSDWGQPPARVGRDPRYHRLPVDTRYNRFNSAAVGDRSFERRFAYSGRN